MEQLVQQWGYWAIFLGCFLEGETVLVLGGMLAHQGLLHLKWVIVTAGLGSLLGDQLWFLSGRYAGQRWLGRFHRVEVLSERVRQWTTRFGAWFVLGFRFLYGIRTVTPLVLGVSHYPVKRFIALNVLGAALWSVIVAYLGWSVGETIERVFGRAARIEEILVLGVVIVVGLSIWHRKKAEK